MLQQGAKKLKSLQKIAYFFIISLLLSACTTPSQPVDNSSQKNDLIQIENHKGRLNLETAIARSLKYNIQPVKQQISNKFLGPEARQNAFSNLRKLKEGQSAGLAVSQKELDFSILYAAINYNTDTQKIDDIFNQITAQNIVLATIKAHKNALYEHKKTFEVKRKIRQYQKQIADLIKKSSNKSYAYQKKLEESIDTLNTMLVMMEQNLKDFRQLVKIETAKLEFEGRRFFDTITLQPQTHSSDYQQAAFENRIELADFPMFSLENISKIISDKYPEKQTTSENSDAQQSIIAQGDAQASVLLQTMLDYQKASNRKKQEILPKLSEELHKAIYLQVETAYQLAKRTTSDYEEQQKNIKQLQQIISKLEKISHPTEEQRINLIQARTDLLKNELLADQILAEKALTISSLHFYDGQIKISQDLLQKNISEIATYFSENLQKDFPKKEKTSYSSSQNNTDLTQTNSGWAHGENWLEDLMSQNPIPATPKLMSSNKTSMQDCNQKHSMQLGAYLNEETAKKEWNKLIADFPELANYEPNYEQISAAGIPLFRLTIKSTSGGFKDICAKLRQNGRECFLRD